MTSIFMPNEPFAHLHLNRKTVESYRRRAKDTLGYETLAELLQHAVQWTLSHRQLR